MDSLISWFAKQFFAYFLLVVVENVLGCLSATVHTPVELAFCFLQSFPMFLRDQGCPVWERTVSCIKMERFYRFVHVIEYV